MKSLSARLLVLTAVFVMISEVLIFVPSVADFRMSYFEDRIAAGHDATLALVATARGPVSQPLTDMVLLDVGAHEIILQRPGGVALRLSSPNPPPADATIDLRRATVFGMIRWSLATFLESDARVLRILGTAANDPGETVELLIDEHPLKKAMWRFGRHVLELSIIISLVSAAFVYLSLQWLLVRPMRRITESMTLFRADPEDPSRRIAPSRRQDEIGRAERELGVLQETVRQALGHRARLAALGTAVTKINHDLRNILATARLVTDGLSTSTAPEVRRVARRLVEAIDRAIGLCTQTLDFSREGAPPFAPSRFRLAPLIAEIGPDLAAGDAAPAIACDVPPELVVTADREQLYRVLLNLARNAFEAGAPALTISAREADGEVAIEIADDGPGLPPRARDNLFRPFFGSARPGGSGLGLAIARELMRLHGGELALVSSTAAGTVFRLSLPATPVRAAEFSRAPGSAT